MVFSQRDRGNPINRAARCRLRRQWAGSSDARAATHAVARWRLVRSRRANRRRIGAAVQCRLLLEIEVPRDHRSRIQLRHRRGPNEGGGPSRRPGLEQLLRRRRHRGVRTQNVAWRSRATRCCGISRCRGGRAVSRASTCGRGRRRLHIREVAGHYRGRVHAWDVVNEAVSDERAGLCATPFQSEARRRLHRRSVPPGARSRSWRAALLQRLRRRRLWRQSNRIYDLVSNLLPAASRSTASGLQMHVSATTGRATGASPRTCGVSPAWGSSSTSARWT